MSTADRGSSPLVTDVVPDVAPDEAKALAFGPCRFSCPPDLMMDDADPDTRARRSTLARLFGVRPQPMPEPKPARTDQTDSSHTRTSMSGARAGAEAGAEAGAGAGHPSNHRMMLSTAPLVSAREREARDRSSSPRWHYPTSVQPRPLQVQAHAQAKQTETEVEALPDPDLDRKPESTSNSSSPARSPSSTSPHRHFRSRSSLSTTSTNAGMHLVGVGAAVGVGDDVVTLHDQIRLLMLNLEEEKKRRASEQQLMQQRILELQSVIRRNFPEQQRALERRVQNSALSSSLNSSLSNRGSAAHPRVRLNRSTRTMSFKNMKAERRRERVASSEDVTDDEASESDKFDTTQAQAQDENQTEEQAQAQTYTQDGDVIDTADRADETRRRQHLSKLRSKMKAMVVEAQQETRTLKLQMVEERRSYEKRERQLRSDSIVHLATLEEKHLHTQHQLTKTVEALTMQVETLSEEKRRMQEELEAKDARIRELELALQAKAVVQGQGQQAMSA